LDLVSAAHRKTALETALGIGLALILVGLAAVFLYAGVGFGGERGEMRIDLDSRPLAARLNRAGNIALAFVFALEVGAAWLLFRSRQILVPRLHGVIQFFSLLIGAILCSYVLAMLSLAGIAPDPIYDLERILSAWLMRIAA
jgi:hypothetical protein